MELIELMRGFGEKIGLASLESSADGAFRFEIDDMTVSFAEVPETRQLVTWAEVGEPPPEGREEFYRTLLEAMYLGRVLDGSTFAIDSDTGIVRLYRFDPLPLLDIDAFMSTLEKFVNVLEKWRHIVSGYHEIVDKLPKVASDGAEDSRQFSIGGFMQV